MKPRRSKPHRAVTSDVIGDASPPNEHIPSKWKTQYRRLAKMRDFLLNRKGDLVKDASEEQPAFSLHMADAGTDSFDRDLALSRLSSEQDAIYEIDEAMMRIRNGTYGICELTGKPIDAKRLQAIPWTRFSAAAETQLERDGELHRSRLAPREALARGVNASNEAPGSTDDEKFQ